jgi:hypothetical protein
MHRRLFLGGVLGLALACGDKEEEDTSASGDDSGSGGDDTSDDANAVDGYAVVVPTCAPDDGAAFEVQIGQDTAGCEAVPPSDGEWLRIAIWWDSSGTAGESYDLAPGAGVGSVWLFPAGPSSAFQGVTSGFLRIDSWDEAGDITGGYEIMLDDGTSRDGDFGGPWCPDAELLCG